MPKKTKISKKEQARISDLVKKWQGLMYLSQWKITVEVDEERRESADENSAVLAAIDPDSTYKTAILFLFKDWFEVDKYQQEGAIIHELAHCIVQPYRNALEQAMGGTLVTPQAQNEINETITSHIANVIQRGNKL